MELQNFVEEAAACLEAVHIGLEEVLAWDACPVALVDRTAVEGAYLAAEEVASCLVVASASYLDLAFEVVLAS